MFEYCKTQQSKNNFFLIVFENLSIEVLSLLHILEQKKSFIKIKRAENINNNNDLEANLQLNSSTTKAGLSNSSLCLLISCNPRYEGYYLNLNLRQRFFKGNFKCLIIGSLIDLTFPVSSLGSNISVLKTILEGNNLACQEFKAAKNPIIIYNYELLKRNGNKNNTENLLNLLKYAQVFNKVWNGINVLSPSLSEVGSQSLYNFSALNSKDLNNFSSVYFLNVSLNNVSNLKKITELKLLNYSNTNTQNSLFLNQSNDKNLDLYNELFSNSKNLSHYLHLPSTIFYENEETFINTEGFVKRTTKLIFRKSAKSNWQILRRVLKSLKTQVTFLNNKDNNLVIFNSKKLLNFKNYIYFHYQATQTLTNLNFYLGIKNENFIILNNNSNFKQRRSKVKLTKLKYWLDDFFSGGKDEYSHKSLVLANCSKILRAKATNFFS